MTIRWQAMGVGREYRLFQEKQIVGILKNNIWNRKAYGELRGYLMRFEMQGYGQRKARILDIEGQRVLGSIEFRFFPRKAVIHYEEERYEWLNSEKDSGKGWSVSGDTERTDYQSADASASNGTITDAYLHPVVLMAGLFVQGYFLKRLFLLSAASLAFLLGALFLFFE